MSKWIKKSKIWQSWAYGDMGLPRKKLMKKKQREWRRKLIDVRSTQEVLEEDPSHYLIPNLKK